MDPMALATTAVAALLPYLAKGAETAAGELGKQGVAAGEAIFKALKARWQGKPDAEQKLATLEADPKSSTEPLVSALHDELQDDKAFADRIAALLKGKGPDISVEVNVDTADTLDGPRIGKARAGKLTATMTARKVGKLGVLDIEEMG